MSRRKVRGYVTVIEQNMTESAPPAYYWAADVLLLSETDHAAIRRTAPDHWRFYLPAGDSHQAIGWNTETMRLDDGPEKPTRSFRFHQSGKAEGWKLRTPSRWLHEVDLIHRDTDTDFTFGAMWWLNSWRKEARRFRIVRDTTIPLVKQRMDRCVIRGRRGIYGGDTNHVTFKFAAVFGGWRTAPLFGLDRLFWRGRLSLVSLKRGAKVGVGNQMRHESLIAEYAIR